MESSAPTPLPDLVEADTSQRRRRQNGIDEPISVGRYEIDGEYETLNITVVKCGDLFYPTTECCGASATGSMGATCCRACYTEVDSILGACWTETEWHQRAFPKVSDQ